MTLRPNSAAIGGTSSTPPVDEYSRIARVSGASFFMSARIFSALGMLSTSGCAGSLERRIGDARQDAREVGGLLLVPESAPQRGVNRGHKQQNGDDGAHRD